MIRLGAARLARDSPRNQDPPALAELRAAAQRAARGCGFKASRLPIEWCSRWVVLALPMQRSRGLLSSRAGLLKAEERCDGLSPARHANRRRVPMRPVVCTRTIRLESRRRFGVNGIRKRTAGSWVGCMGRLRRAKRDGMARKRQIELRPFDERSWLDRAAFSAKRLNGVFAATW